ncbi:putative oxidase [Sinomonas cyclohexanicum]|uniref:Oxidase n=1 Tax=Sinomonas cyclohexanicum TaxID=322009 RepID=A0ABM7Q086_SINCY|nr:multicopper oxidase family protein [Corynebacterium cyclohexanicum]BCT77877.1 putative oxidase [Corynebacterium cyclohexanicum]
MSAPRTGRVTRRSYLGLSLAAASAALFAACTPPSEGVAVASRGAQRVLSGDDAVKATEAARASSGRTVTANLSAGPITASLEQQPVATWGYNGAFNGPLLRGSVGDRLEVALANGLPEPTVLHWHGLALANDQDGVEITQKGVEPGKSFQYGFKLSHPGTYWYHSHVELQRERALYGPLIVDDPSEPKDWDREWVILLDDWMDGITGTPESVLKELQAGMGGMSSGMPGMGAMQHGHMLMGATSDFLGGDAGDVRYPFYLFNGRTPSEAATLVARPGDRVRLRIINAAGDTAFRVGAPGVKLTVTHTDGYPVEPKEADAVVLGMGERIDALLTVPEGWTPLMARPEGKQGLALGRISTGTGKEPVVAALPARLGGTVVDGGQLASTPAVRLPSKAANVRHTVRLTGSMMAYDWGLSGRRFDMADPFAGALEVRQGDRVQIDFVNESTMWHPMHVHGHTFQIGESGARKDTVIVRPGTTVSVNFDADNPGQWLYHCHNAYHAARGMTGVISYVR